MPDANGRQAFEIMKSSATFERIREMLFVMFLIVLLAVLFSISGTVFAAVPEKFTERARLAVARANKEAISLKSDQIDTEHLLLGVVYEGQGIAARILQELDVDLELLEQKLKDTSGKHSAPVARAGKTPLPFTDAATKAMEYSAEEAQKAKLDYVGTEHLLLGLAREKTGGAARALRDMGVTKEAIRNALAPISSIPASDEVPYFHELRDCAGDATSQIQRNLDRVGKTGGEVFLPAGSYRLDGPLTIPPGVTLRGTWQGPHHARLKTGTVLYAYAGRGQEDGAPLIALSPGATISGITIFYPEQSIDDVQPYPWAIQCRGMHNSIVNVTLVNPYKGIDIGTYHNELHYIRNVFGCPIKIGLYVNNCTDIGRIENVHFNPHYWARDEGDGEQRPNWEKLIDYLLKNGEGFVFGRTDWEYVLDTFCYGYRVGYHFVATEQGVCNGNFLGIGADGTQNAIVVEQSAPYGILITNGEFVSMRAEDPVEIIVSAENTGTIQFNNCAFWGPSSQIARIQGKGYVSFLQCNFVDWDFAKKKLPAIDANGGSLSVQSCTFQKAGRQIHLGQEHGSAIIRGNFMKGEIGISNESRGNVQLGFNVTN